jgi:hypothetical protein
MVVMTVVAMSVARSVGADAGCMFYLPRPWTRHGAHEHLCCRKDARSPKYRISGRSASQNFYPHERDHKCSVAKVFLICLLAGHFFYFKV